MTPRLLAGLLFASLVAGTARSAPPTDVGALLAGKYDNVAQTKSDASLPHVVVTIERTPKPEWTLWAVHVDTGFAKPVCTPIEL